MKPGLLNRENRPILVDRTESRHGVRQARGGHHLTNAWQCPGVFIVYGKNPSVGAVDGDQLHMQHVFQADVTHELLLSGYPFVPPDPAN
jgi:hypothetical protein